MTAASSVTGVYRRGDTTPWGASTRYVQFSSGSGVFYDRLTSSVVNEVPAGSGTFTAVPNQATAKATYAGEISGITSAGPIGTPVTSSPAAAGAALTGTTPPPPEPFEGTVSIPAPAVSAGTGSTGLRYPSARAMTSDTDYVVFEFFKYEPPFGSAEFGSTGVTAIATDIGTAGYRNYQGNRGPKAYDPIILYMPEDIQSQFSARWSGASFSAAAAGIANSIGTEALDKLKAGADTIPGLLKNAIFKGALEGLNSATGSSISENQLLGGVSGTIINPNVEMMYEAPDLRNFSLSFKMTPHDGNEAKTIRRICQRFKKVLLPSFGGQAIFGEVTAPNLLTIPPLCQVTFMKGTQPHPSLPQYKLCAVSNVDINYTPDGSYATFGDAAGSPVATSLTIQFKETKLVFSQEINEDAASY